MTQQQVFDALNRATAGGYDLSGLADESIVNDLLSCEADAEHDTYENLLPHVAAWKENRL